MGHLPSNEPKITRIDLPFSVGDWVEVDTRPFLAGDFLGLDTSAGTVAIAYELMAQRISSWSFTNEDGTPTPVSDETIKKLPADDFTAVSAALNAPKPTVLPIDEKKI